MPQALQPSIPSRVPYCSNSSLELVVGHPLGQEVITNAIWRTCVSATIEQKMDLVSDGHRSQRINSRWASRSGPPRCSRSRPRNATHRHRPRDRARQQRGFVSGPTSARACSPCAESRAAAWWPRSVWLPACPIGLHEGFWPGSAALYVAAVMVYRVWVHVVLVTVRSGRLSEIPG